MVSIYGYPCDEPRTSALVHALMEAIAVYGGHDVLLGDFNCTQQEGAVASILSRGGFRAADDSCCVRPDYTNPQNTRRIDFASSHPALAASQVHTFRDQATSDHGIVRIDYEDEGPTALWHKPCFSEPPLPADVSGECPEQPA